MTIDPIKKEKAQKDYLGGLSLNKIAEKYKIARSTVQAWAKSDGWDKPEQPEPIYDKEHFATKIHENKNASLVRNLKKELAQSLGIIDELNETIEDILQLKENSPIEVHKIDFTHKKTSEAIPIIQFSDWHVEERVESNTTHGLNVFNPDICRKRVQKLTENTLKTIRKERQNVDINQLFICLGGDFINNYLHDHDTQMNYMSPIEASLFAKELIKQSLIAIAEYAMVNKITIMCIRGNHGRLTKKMQSSNDYKMNLEAIIYHSLRHELNDEIFDWQIPDSGIGYTSIGDKTIRSLHGHEVKYGGGIGGITIPLIKYILRLNQTFKADYTNMHHYHYLNYIADCNTSINGSLVGYNSYAMQLGAKFEVPKQSFQLLDRKRGLTVRTPIFCE
jgi:predicted DNA-binding protein YlxM (UPF0122 family)